MIDLNDMRLFVKVVDAQGFSSAARALGRPKSSVSHRIAKLDEHLEARLIQRTSRRFAVTDVGQEFYRHACAMLTEALAAEEAVQRRTAEPRGTVRLTSSVATAHAGLASILADFAETFPEVRIHLSAKNRAVDLVEEGYDLAVRAHEQPLADSGMLQRRLGFSPRWLVAAPRYAAHRGTPRHPADLGDHVMLCMSADLEVIWTLVKTDGTRVQVTAQSSYGSDDVASLLIAARCGAGIAALPAGLCQPDLKRGDLLRILPGWIAGGAVISILTPHRRGQLPAVRAVSDFIAEHLPPAMGIVGDGPP